MEAPIPILYEDNHLIIAEKPCSIPTQPCSSHQTSVETVLKDWIKRRDGKPSSVFLHAVFRLDLPVSGIVLFAKSAKALARLNEMQRQHAYTKEYTAWVYSAAGTEPKPALLVDFLLRGEHATAVVSEGTPNSLEAKTRIISVEPAGRPGFYILQLELLTGRYHQIRAQLASRGFPIVGDLRYGSSASAFEGRSFGPNAIALHHARLAFLHPVKKAGEEARSLVDVRSAAF